MISQLSLQQPRGQVKVGTCGKTISVFADDFGIGRLLLRGTGSDLISADEQSPIEAFEDLIAYIHTESCSLEIGKSSMKSELVFHLCQNSMLLFTTVCERRGSQTFCGQETIFFSKDPLIIVTPIKHNGRT